jgi:hypothetical protein
MARNEYSTIVIAGPHVNRGWLNEVAPDQVFGPGV